MYRAAIVGFGNIGKYAIDAVLGAPDFELAGLVRRNPAGGIPGIPGSLPVTADISELGKVDVAILCTPTRSCEEHALKYLRMGINTVDSFDDHSSIYELKVALDGVAKEKGAVAIVSAGWDPGTDSVVRVLLSACAPKGITYTNFGPGMSMGHSVAARAIDGVKDALSMTLPLGAGIHRRVVYVALEADAELGRVAADLKADPYFSKDETHVIQVGDVGSVLDKGHGVNMLRKGVSGATDNQRFEFNMSINNPALTSQIMVSYARASMKALPGAYTPIEIPPANLLYGDIEELIREFV